MILYPMPLAVIVAELEPVGCGCLPETNPTHATNELALGRVFDVAALEDD
jgi:hypothetical protein